MSRGRMLVDLVRKQLNKETNPIPESSAPKNSPNISNISDLGQINSFDIDEYEFIDSDTDGNMQQLVNITALLNETVDYKNEQNTDAGISPILRCENINSTLEDISTENFINISSSSGRKYMSSGSEYIADTESEDEPSLEDSNTGEDLETIKDIALPSTLKSISTKHLCPFCFKEVGHFSRHMFRNHSDEDAIKKLLTMPIKSAERRSAINALRKKGNFVLNQQKDKLNPVRKSNRFNQTFEHNNTFDSDEYVPCIHCLGFYKRVYLWRHIKICRANTTVRNTGIKNQVLTESQTFLAATALHGNYIVKGRLKNEVFNIMRPDNISFTAKTDSLICLYGESNLCKHKRKQMNIVVSNKMREMARLKLALQQSTTITNLIDALKPEMYNSIVAACQIIAGYNSENRTFVAPSLALHMGTNLKFLCSIARKAILTKNPIFLNVNGSEKVQEISTLRDTISEHWCNDISSIAHKSLNEKKWTKPKLLPATEDVQAFNKYVTENAEMAYMQLKNNVDIESNYKLLTECVLSAVLIFNRKRIGEVLFLEIATYESDPLAIHQEECLSSLSELEKVMCKSFKRVVVLGKGSKPVPILFTQKMQRYIKLIIKIRRTTDIVPISNKYVFANPGSTDRWMSGASVLRKFAKKCGAINPELLTSTRFRKQVATILQLMSFEKDEIEQIARFMGHTEKTHLEFYRLTEDTYQTAKVAKVLLLLNAGKGSEIKGKNLEEIEIAEELIWDENNDYEESMESEIIERIDHIYEQDILENDENVPPPDNYTEDITRDAPKKPGTRKRWSAYEKKTVLEYFKDHIIHKHAPKKNECYDFINQNNNLFVKEDWVRIKTLIFNTYRVAK